MTWLEILNRVFLQWFFIRLFRITEDGKKQKFRFGGWIEPLSGWGNNFKWHGRILFGKKLVKK